MNKVKFLMFALAATIAVSCVNDPTSEQHSKTDAVIDYIYVSGFSACPEYKTVIEKYADKPFVSDHYPVYARLIF